MNKYLTLEEVMQITTLSRNTIYLHRKKGIFPQPLKFGQRKNLWLQSDIEEWLDNRPRAGS